MAPNEHIAVQIDTISDASLARNPPHQTYVRKKYESNFVQIAVAILIGWNFLVSAINAQILPDEGSGAFDVFYGFEVFFAVIFTLELMWNSLGQLNN